MNKKILIEGMMCEHCVGHVKEALEKIENVKLIEVRLEGKYALVETSVKDDVLKNAIEEEGYDVIKVE